MYPVMHNKPLYPQKPLNHFKQLSACFFFPKLIYTSHSEPWDIKIAHKNHINCYLKVNIHLSENTLLKKNIILTLH